VFRYVYPDVGGSIGEENGGSITPSGVSVEWFVMDLVALPLDSAPTFAKATVRRRGKVKSAQGDRVIDIAVRTA
jgi:hypothetical protein